MIYADFSKENKGDGIISLTFQPLEIEDIRTLDDLGLRYNLARRENVKSFLKGYISQSMFSGT